AALRFASPAGPSPPPARRPDHGTRPSAPDSRSPGSSPPELSAAAGTTARFVPVTAPLATSAGIRADAAHAVGGRDRLSLPLRARSRRAAVAASRVRSAALPRREPSPAPSAKRYDSAPR